MSVVHAAVCVCVAVDRHLCFSVPATHAPCVCVCVRFLGAITTTGRFTGAISRSKFVK